LQGIACDKINIEEDIAKIRRSLGREKFFYHGEGERCRSHFFINSNGDVNLPVKEAKIVSGFWEVFPDSAGFGLGSAYPDETGNTVIFAHARQGLFLPLKDIKTGENILVLTADAWYSYTVAEIKEVLPSQTEVIGPTDNSILTLYTCSGLP